MANLLPRGLRRKSLSYLTIQSDDSPSLHGHVRCWDAFVRNRDGRGRGFTVNSGTRLRRGRVRGRPLTLSRAASVPYLVPLRHQSRGGHRGFRLQLEEDDDVVVFRNDLLHVSRVATCKTLSGPPCIGGVVIRLKEPQESPPAEGAAARARLGILGGRSGSRGSGNRRGLRRSGERGRDRCQSPRASS